jgi:cephalosporin-C deacetylase-like acetyl esterase
MRDQPESKDGDLARRAVGILALALVAALGLAAGGVWAVERAGVVRVGVVPDHAGWTYGLGEPARFQVTVTRDGHPLSGVAASYSCGPEQMPPTLEEETALPADGLVIEAGTLSEPGFLRCVVTTSYGGREYRGVGTAGFVPEAILPTVEDPDDFDAFWARGMAELARLPRDARLTPKPDLSTAKAEVYHVSLQNVGSNPDGGTSRFYGILAVPKGEGPFPAVFNPPGAGARPYRGLVDMAERGFLTFQVGIHGIPVDLDPEVYDSLLFGPLAAWGGYGTFNLDDRDRYYYRRVYLGCVRANDLLVSHPKWDGRNLVVTGGSQGGALTITTAALDPRVTALAPFYPALSDLTGYLQGRAGGWPHLFKSAEDGHRTEAKIRTAAYYDVVNFARRLKAPGLYSWGFNDEICPPTSMYAAYNVVTAPKGLLLALETGHFTVPEQAERVDRWIEEQVGRTTTP